MNLRINPKVQLVEHGIKKIHGLVSQNKHRICKNISSEFSLNCFGYTISAKCTNVNVNCA